MNKFYISIIFILSSFVSFSQSNFSINTSSLGYCFQNSNTHLYKNFAFSNKNLPLDVGFIFSYDSYIIKDVFSAKFQQTIVLDRANKRFGFSSIGVNQRLLKSFKHEINIYGGVAILYRQTWNSDSLYINNEHYVLNNQTQYKYFQFVGGLEYGYQITNKVDLLFSLTYYQSNTLNASLGLKIWIDKKYKKKRECISCPNLH